MRAWRVFITAGFAATGFAIADDSSIEVRSPNFTVVSDAGEGTAQRTAVEFEQLRAAYAKLWPWAQMGQPRPTVVLALKDKSSFRKWFPGYYDKVRQSAVGADRFNLIQMIDGPRPPMVAPNFFGYRDYAGLLLNASFERRLPPWLSSGLSSVLGNASVSGKEIRVGQLVPWELQHFKEGDRLPLRTLLEADLGTPLLDRAHFMRFSAQSHVLVHYLVFGDKGTHARSLSRFLQLWLSGSPPDEALAGAFGDLDALESRLVVYASSNLFSYARFDADMTIESASWPGRVLPLAEVASLQAALHVAMRRPVEAQTAIREARTTDSRSPCSYDAEGLLADFNRDEPRAAEAYTKAVELGSTSPYSHYRAAQLAWKPQSDAATLRAVRQWLERATELNPSYANAYSLLAEVLVELGDAEVAVASGQRAVALEPGGSYHHVAFGRVLHALGLNDDALKQAKVGDELAADATDYSNAESFRQSLKEEGRYAQEGVASLADARTAEARQSSPAPAPETLDYASLSGSWMGTMIVLQRGRCTMNGSSRSNGSVRVLVRVAEDGTFRAGMTDSRLKGSVMVTKAADPTFWRWQGRISPDLMVTMMETATASCDKQRREYQLEYSGRIARENDKQRLELEAEDPVCPKTHCIFKLVIKVTKE